MLLQDKLSQVECFLMKNYIKDAKIACNSHVYFPVEKNMHLFTNRAKILKREDNVHWIDCDPFHYCRIRFDQELPFKWFSDNMIHFGFIENGYVIFNIKYIINNLSLKFTTL